MNKAPELSARLPVFAFDRLSDHVIITDAGDNEARERQIVYVNPAYLESTGYSREEVIGRSPSMFRGKDTDRQAERRIAEKLRRGENVREVLLNYTKSGAPYLAELNITPIRNERGAIIFYCTIQRDVTRQAKRTEALELERRLKAAGEEVGLVGTWAYLVDEDRVIWSEGTYRIFGVEPGTPLQGSDHGMRYIAPKDRSVLRDISANCIRQQIRQHNEISGIKENGELINLVAIAEPIIGEDGRTKAVAGALRDITDEKKMRNALGDSLLQHEMIERHFASARKAGRIAVFDYSVGQDLQYWSDELFEMTGLAPDDFPAPAASFVDRLLGDDRDEFIRLSRRALEHGEGFVITVRFQRPDGQVLRLEVRADTRDSEAGRRLVGIARDVTSELNASEELRRQEERFRIIADTLSDVLWDYDFETQTFWVTPHWPEKLKLSLEEAAFDPMKWSAHILPADKQQAEASLADAILLGSSRWQCSFRVKEPDGHFEHIEIKASILRRSEGGVHRILGNIRNVTLEKQAEEGFTRSRALEAIGKMTGGVAHDFNNLLMIIQGNAELLSLSELAPDDHESVTLIEKASRSAAELTNRLLTFSGQTRLDTARANVNDVIAQLRPLLKSALTERVELVTEACEGVWDIEVDQGELEQAIINLAVNARDAMPAGGKVRVTCENMVMPNGADGPALQLEPGRYVCISVSDTGIGMSKEVSARAIDPFFTTKEFGKGTGLGLSSVYGFAKQSGGTIRIESEEGVGTRIVIILPASIRDTAAAPRPSPAPQIPPPAEGRRILVVEDQKDVRAHVEKLLSRAGFEVCSASDADHALETLRSGERFDVLFTDIIMPGGKNGVELAREAQEVAPEMKVLFTSGFPASALDHLDAADKDKMRLLKKPYSRSELIAVVSNLAHGL